MQTPIKNVVAGVAAVAVAVGAYLIGHSSSSSNSTPAVASAQRFAPGGAAGTQQGGMPQTQNGQLPQTQNGQVPQGGPGGFAMGTPVTGAAAQKAADAATKRYGGQVERVFKLDDGSYEVHVITGSTEYHVAVSKDFEVTGANQGGPGGGVPGGSAPSGSAPTAPSTTN